MGLIGLFICVLGFFCWAFTTSRDEKSNGNETGPYAGGLKIERVVNVDGCLLTVDFKFDGGPDQLTKNVVVRVAGLAMPKADDNASQWARYSVGRMIFDVLSKPDARIEALGMHKANDGVFEADFIVNGKSLVMGLQIPPFHEQEKEKEKPMVEYIIQQPYPPQYYYNGNGQRMYSDERERGY